LDLCKEKHGKRTKTKKEKENMKEKNINLRSKTKKIKREITFSQWEI